MDFLLKNVKINAHKMVIIVSETGKRNIFLSYSLKLPTVLTEIIFLVEKTSLKEYNRTLDTRLIFPVSR